MTPTPFITLRSSRILAAVLVIAHGLAIGAIVFAALPVWWLTLMIVIGIFASLVFNLWSVLPNRPGAIVIIALSEGGTLNIQDRRGHWFECRALGSTYVSRFLAVLNLQSLENGMVKRVVILPDMVNPEDFRVLRVWLRWKAKSPEPESIEMPWDRS